VPESRCGAATIGTPAVREADLAPMAAAIGGSARAAMLAQLMDGRSLLAEELARRAGVSPATASAHLARLAAAGLVGVQVQGRHRCSEGSAAELYGDPLALDGETLAGAGHVTPASDYGPWPEALVWCLHEAVGSAAARTPRMTRWS